MNKYIVLSSSLSFRQTKPLIAQLIRIHVVTPKAPVHVTLNPRVQPGPPPCPTFVTGCEEPIKLSQSAYWILRLPYPFLCVTKNFIYLLYILNADNEQTTSYLLRTFLSFIYIYKYFY